MIRLLHLLAAIAALLISGCAALSGRASMQVEVDVYQGPLSKEFEVQLAEFEGSVESSVDALRATIKFHQQTYGFAGCEARHLIEVAESGRTDVKIKADHVLRATDPLPDICRRWPGDIAVGLCQDAELKGCPTPDAAQIRTIGAARLAYWALAPLRQRRAASGYPRMTCAVEIHNADSALNSFCRTHPHDAACGDPLEKARKCLINRLQAVAQAAHEIQAGAQYVATGHVAQPSLERDQRGFVAGYVVLAAEVANQLGSRADVLIKQLSGDQRHVMPLSMHLRDANPTRFLQLYSWWRAGPPAPYEGSLAARSLDERVDDRVNVVEQLWADQFWRRVNTVHAHGRGDVRMAFIKDDIGNWQLKSFSNDPEALLNSYVQIGRAATAFAAGVLSGGAPVAEAAQRLTASQQAIALVDRAALGQSPTQAASEGQQYVARFELQLHAELEQIKTGLDTALAAISALEQDLKAAKTAAEAGLVAAEAKLRELGWTSDQALADQRAQRAQLESNLVQARAEQVQAASATEEARVAASTKVKDIEAQLSVLRAQLAWTEKAEAIAAFADRARHQAVISAATTKLAELPAKRDQAVKGASVALGAAVDLHRKVLVKAQAAVQPAGTAN